MKVTKSQRIAMASAGLAVCEQQARVFRALRDYGPQSPKYKKARKKVAALNKAYAQAIDAIRGKPSGIVKPVKPKQDLQTFAKLPEPLTYIRQDVSGVVYPCSYYSDGAFPVYGESQVVELLVKVADHFGQR